MQNNKNKSALAINRFETTADAIEAVKSLYTAGAERVDVVVKYFESWRTSKEGGPYADELEVTFPRVGVTAVLKVIKSLHPDNWETDATEPENRYVDDGSYAGNSVPLGWD